MSKAKRIEGPFTNEYGTFNPGDSCIAVTVCTGRVNLARVEYLGYVEREDYNYKKGQYEMMKYVQIRRPTSTFKGFYVGTDEPARWPYKDSEVEYRHFPGTVVSTLQHNRLLPASATVDELIKEI